MLTSYQWGVIVGSSHRPGVPVWYATAGSQAAAPGYCASTCAFTGAATVSLVQYVSGSFDGDYAC